MTTNVAQDTTAVNNSYRFIVAYVFAFLIFFGISRSKVGYNFIYYALVLALLFLCLTEAPYIAGLLSPITNPNSVQTKV